MGFDDEEYNEYEDILKDIDIDEFVTEEHEIGKKVEVPIDDSFFTYDKQKAKEEDDGSLKKTLDNSITKAIRDKKKKDEFLGLKEKQLEAIELIVKGYTNTEISRTLDVPTSTISRWKQQAKFAEVLERTKLEYLSAFQQHLVALIPKATQELSNILDQEEIKYSDKLQAIKTVFEYTNIKNGGIKTVGGEETNINTVQVVMVNSTPPSDMMDRERQDDMRQEKSDLLDDIIDAEIMEER